MPKVFTILYLLFILFSDVQSEPLSLYDYLVCLSQSCQHHDLAPTQTGDGINGGLEANGPEFKVNGKPIRILSGSLHYFRFSLGFKAHYLEDHPQGAPRLLANKTQTVQGAPSCYYKISQITCFQYRQLA